MEVAFFRLVTFEKVIIAEKLTLIDKKKHT